MADVFISYARRNVDRVAVIADALNHGGYSLWWDRRMLVGDDFALRIEQELNAAECVVVAWSRIAEGLALGSGRGDRGARSRQAGAARARRRPAADSLHDASLR